ncbi:hypothetical protein [Kitasatospora sp. NPDC085464]|uniref:hypothetical protein n=1 Tax=Kitasatospora sp. NPDC085464 TaxID=3364063 RepID=UPI0037CAFED3
MASRRFKSLEVRRRRWKRAWQQNWPYIALFIFIVAPLWWMAASLAIRIGLFGWGDVDSAQVKTFLTFIGGGLGTAATVFGALLTKQHNARERWRQQLDTIVQSLNFIDPPMKQERVAGVFSSMVLLGHQHVAIRMLDPAWRHGNIDAASATWVIGQVLSGEDPSMEGVTASDDTVLEASVILKEHAGPDLVDKDKNIFFFPGGYMHTWPVDRKLPTQAKVNLLSAMGATFLSQDISWWTDGGERTLDEAWPLRVWKDCTNGAETDAEIREDAKHLLNAVNGAIRTDELSAMQEKVSPPLRATFKSLVGKFQKSDTKELVRHRRARGAL